MRQQNRASARGARSIAAGSLWTEADGFLAFVIVLEWPLPNGKRGSLLSWFLRHGAVRRQRCRAIGRTRDYVAWMQRSEIRGRCRRCSLRMDPGLRFAPSRLRLLLTSPDCPASLPTNIAMAE